ncbi:hypothetical protein [Mycobacterium sp.]|uniref:hypothetical protein n=1 Tax=Mycobacterium sp. TaxID=1785 RepID=UPI003F7DC3B1
MANIYGTRVGDFGLGSSNVSHPTLDHRIQPSTRFHAWRSSVVRSCNLHQPLPLRQQQLEVWTPHPSRAAVALNEQRLRDRDLIMTSKPCRWRLDRMFSNAIFNRDA